MIKVARQKPVHRKSEAGMTLIEVLIALFVFAIGALAIAAMTFMSIQGNAFSNRMTQATLIAQDKMEALFALQGMQNPVGRLASALAESPDPVDAYTLSYMSTGNGPVPNSQWLNVEVTWSDAKGDHRVLIRSLWRAL